MSPSRVLVTEIPPGHLPLIFCRYKHATRENERTVTPWPHPWLYVATLSGLGTYHEDFAMFRARASRLTPDDDVFGYPLIPYSHRGAVCINHGIDGWRPEKKLQYVLMSEWHGDFYNLGDLPPELQCLHRGVRRYGDWQEDFRVDFPVEGFQNITPEELCTWTWPPAVEPLTWYGEFDGIPMESFSQFREWCKARYDKFELRFAHPTMLKVTE